jgi:hypothetical protein
MVLNAPDMPTRYTMKANDDVPPTEHSDVFLHQAAMRQPDKFLKYFVINCHGIYSGGAGTRPAATVSISLVGFAD